MTEQRYNAVESESSEIYAYWESFPDRLRAILKERGVRQVAFAEQLGISPSSFNNWLGGRKIPSASRLIQMADLLELSLDDLIGRTPPRNNRTRSQRGAVHTKGSEKTKSAQRKKK